MTKKSSSGTRVDYARHFEGEKSSPPLNCTEFWLGFRGGCTEFWLVRDQENTPPPTGYWWTLPYYRKSKQLVYILGKKNKYGSHTYLRQKFGGEGDFFFLETHIPHGIKKRMTVRPVYDHIPPKGPFSEKVQGG